jgi:hypothetical protein
LEGTAGCAIGVNSQPVVNTNGLLNEVATDSGFLNQNNAETIVLKIRTIEMAIISGYDKTFILIC